MDHLRAKLLIVQAINLKLRVQAHRIYKKFCQFCGYFHLVPKLIKTRHFFPLFLNVSPIQRGWPEADLILPFALTAKPQEMYSALRGVDSQKYFTVKDTVVKTYEMVPEAYQQHFGSWMKSDKQTRLVCKGPN